MKVKVDGMSEKPRSAEQAQYGVSSEAELESDVARQQEQEGDATTNGNVDPGPDQEFEGVERDTDSIVKPEPPPRVDSNQPESTRNQGVNVSSDPEPVSLFSQRVCPPKMPRKRHLVDYLGQEEEGTFMWDSQRAYLITCMGFINSLGCLLKASVGLVKHGGGVFFIAYVISMVAFGCPLVYLETTLGQYAVGGPLNAWKVIPLFTGVGYCMVVLTFLVSSYYVMEVVWAIYYFGVAMSVALGGNLLPWQCGNGSECGASNETLVAFYGDVSHLPRHWVDNSSQLMPESQRHAAEYSGAFQYFNDILQATEGVTKLGEPIWYLVLCLLLVWVCIFTCLIHGPSSIGKIMYMLAPFPYVVMLILFIMVCMKEGSIAGVRFFLSPVWHKLGKSEIWYDAGKLLFLTLSLGMGNLHTLAGYTHFHSHCYRNLLLICMSNVAAVLLGGLTVCSGLGILANLKNISVYNISNISVINEYDLGYAIFPFILTRVSNSMVFVMLFYSVIIVVGMSTCIIYVQSIMGAIVEKLRDFGVIVTKRRRWLIQMILCLTLFLIGLLFTTKMGVYIVFFVDRYVTRIAPFIVVLLECCGLMYIFGARKFMHNIEDMMGHKNSPWWTATWKFITPCVLLGLISCTFIFPVSKKFKDILYPDWSEILGWCLSLAPCVCIPTFAVWTLSKETGTLFERIKCSLKTPTDWGAGLQHNPEQTAPAPEYVICSADNHRPMHGLAMLTHNLYVPQLPPLSAEEVHETNSEMTGGGYMSDLLTITSSESIDSGPENEERGNWRTKLEFVLSCLGYVIGLGNIWRFPFLVYRNGGGAFFFAYIIMVALCGLPLVYMEMALGQYASLGPVTLWRAVPLFKGVGYAMVVAVAIICVYYNVVNAWAFHYFFSSFTATLPWASCGNKWNTEDCRLNKFAVTNCSLVNATYLLVPELQGGACTHHLLDCINTTNMTGYQQNNTTECINWLESIYGETIYMPERKNILAKLKDPSAEYFYNEVLNVSDGLDDIGGIQWQLALCLLLCWVIVFMCLVKGIYSAGKVAYFVIIIPIILLLALLVCALLVEGHLEGIHFYLTPKWDHFLSLRVWSDAASQVFFSLSACAGGLSTLSSYNKFHNNIYRDAILICVIDTLMSVLAGFTVFASLGILAHQLDTTVENVITSSERPSSDIGLVFVAIPAAVTHFMPSAMWSAFFFLMIVMMGMSSLLVMTEIIVTVMMDEKVEFFRKSRILVLIAVCSILYLLGLPLTTRGGLYILQLLDEYCGGMPNLVIGLFMCVGLAWVYGVRKLCFDIQRMIGRPVSCWWKAMWSVVSPLIMLFILVSTIVTGLDLGGPAFPRWSAILGITLLVLTVLPIPLFAFRKICTLQGSFIQRVKEACLSTNNWGPALYKALEAGGILPCGQHTHSFCRHRAKPCSRSRRPC
ncbi:hypothetical protein DPMN_106630 [Dreissena polymorpha]|uniref:Transporter n=1 Tax=Dreissena polymorpha TaxID=45954 RepID=A0A9D4QJ51_DREPO|nr:hypothetical protein DPMN_106630 [Dreissena polymorpha]